MNVLLFSMPNSFERTPSFAMRFPNGALASLAGNTLTVPNDRIAVGVYIPLSMTGSGIARLLRVVESHSDSRRHHNDC